MNKERSKLLLSIIEVSLQAALDDSACYNNEGIHEDYAHYEDAWKALKELQKCL